MRYIFTNNWIYLAKIMGYSWDIFGKKYGIYFGKYGIYIFGKKYGRYWDKTIGYFMGYLRPKIWGILPKNNGIYNGIYFSKAMACI